MKRLTWLNCAALSVWLVFSAASNEAPRNLLTNGGFEKAEGGGAPMGWIVASPQSPQIEFKVVPDRPQEGKSCLRIKGSSAWAAAFQKVPLDRAKAYTLTGQIRSVRGYAMIKLDYFNGEEWLGQTLTELFENPQREWKQITVTSEALLYPQATHISATAAVGGDAEADFDAFVLTAR
jgi:hypothetical protein